MRFRRIFIELLIAAIFVSVSLFAYRTWLHPGAQSMRLSMNQKKWLDGYSGETTQQLIAFEGEYRVDSIVLAFEQAIGQKSVRAGETALTADERFVMEKEDPQRHAALQSCDQRYFKESEPIADHLFAYIKTHQDTIRL